MAADKTTQAEVEMRVARLGRIIANGGKRSDCIRYAAENWGVSERTVDRYLMKVSEQFKGDWNIERPELMAVILTQYSSIHMEARRTGQLHIALGATNAMARLAALIT